MKWTLWVTMVAMLACAAPARAQTGVVAEVKADLVARGVNLQGPCGAFQITGRVAYRLRADGWGLIAKDPGQNGCTVEGVGRFAVDALTRRDGSAVDLLINSENENTPAWQASQSDGGLWRAPFALDAPATPAPVPTPTPVPSPQPPPAPDDSLVLSAIAALQVQVARIEVSLEEHRAAAKHFLALVMKYVAPALGTFVTMKLK